MIPLIHSFQICKPFFFKVSVYWTAILFFGNKPRLIQQHLIFRVLLFRVDTQRIAQHLLEHETCICIIMSTLEGYTCTGVCSSGQLQFLWAQSLLGSAPWVLPQRCLHMLQIHHKARLHHCQRPSAHAGPAPVSARPSAGWRGPPHCPMVSTPSRQQNNFLRRGGGWERGQTSPFLEGILVPPAGSSGRGFGPAVLRGAQQHRMGLLVSLFT